MTTRDDILKALGYAGNQIEVMTNPLSPVTWTAERRLIHLADVLADDSLIDEPSKSVRRELYPSDNGKTLEMIERERRYAICLYRAAILAALKGTK